MAAIEKRFYQDVSSLSEESDDFILPNGDRLAFTQFGGDASVDVNVRVEIIWDADGTPEILFATHNSNVQSSIRELVGDGVKVLRIKLTNDSLSSHIIGAYYLGEYYAS